MFVLSFWDYNCISLTTKATSQLSACCPFPSPFPCFSFYTFNECVFKSPVFPFHLFPVLENEFRSDTNRQVITLALRGLFCWPYPACPFIKDCIFHLEVQCGPSWHPACLLSFLCTSLHLLEHRENVLIRLCLFVYQFCHLHHIWVCWC